MAADAALERTARAALEAAWATTFPGEDPTLGEVQFALAVSRHETGHGTRWKGNGVGSHNWGAIQHRTLPKKDETGTWQCPDDGFLHSDSRPTESGQERYPICFRKYPSDVEGAAGLLHQLYVRRPAVRAAAREGKLWQAAAAMYDSHYYQGFSTVREEAIKQYFDELVHHARITAAALEEPLVLDVSLPRRARSSALGFGLLAGAALLGALALKNR